MPGEPVGPPEQAESMEQNATGTRLGKKFSGFHSFVLVEILFCDPGSSYRFFHKEWFTFWRQYGPGLRVCQKKCFPPVSEAGAFSSSYPVELN